MSTFRPKLLPIAAVLLSGTVLFIQSCRKIEPVFIISKTQSGTEAKFFNNHSPTDAGQKVLVDFIQRKNDTLGFVKTTVDRIGYPRWDKAMRFSSNNTIQARTEGDESNTSTTYIPFVREGENHVNAAMLINTSATDTSFSYLCDWQYKHYPNGNMNEAGKAENLAALLMLLDNKTLGHTRFTIIDTSLFKNNTIQPGTNQREIRVGDNSAVNRTESAEPIICYYTYYCGTVAWCTSHGGCDYMNCPSGQCYLISQDCQYYPQQPPGGGSGNGPGGTQTGPPITSGGGSGTPPPCNTTGGKALDPCVPGWEPIPVDDDPLVEDPCDKVDSLKSDAPFRAAFTNLENRTAESKEYGYKVTANGGWSFHQGPANGREGITFQFDNYIHFIMHSHFAGALPIFSVADIETIAGLYDKDLITTDKFFYGLATETGSYVITIENPALFQAFRNEYIDISNYSEQLEIKYSGYKIGKWSDNDKNIKEFVLLMKDLKTGTSLLKANADFTQFSKVSVVNDQLVFTPCN